MEIVCGGLLEDIKFMLELRSFRILEISFKLGKSHSRKKQTYTVSRILVGGEL